MSSCQVQGQRNAHTPHNTKYTASTAYLSTQHSIAQHSVQHTHTHTHIQIPILYKQDLMIYDGYHDYVAQIRNVSVAETKTRKSGPFVLHEAVAGVLLKGLPRVCVTLPSSLRLLGLSHQHQSRAVERTIARLWLLHAHRRKTVRSITFVVPPRAGQTQEHSLS